MTQSNALGLPAHVAAKIEKVLGISSSDLNGYDLVRLIEELCDTALMFDQEERGAGPTGQEQTSGGRSPPPRQQRRTHYVSDGRSSDT